MEENHRLNEQDGRDRFNRLMFGSKRDNEKTATQPTANPSQPSIDFEELMINIDSLIDSASNLKPLFKKAYPLVEQLLKKNKLP
ncbi:hypothetical protein [Neobacillus ginsengisoli]|uniref:Proline dehydrogenase n=1 Tax=Neobacillus ginsengisoli TaxID=904295 RepID=A0ABT9XRI0_9BACI|nr:hypothetical protein [Neobacillus ginsengisoli]MDQ0198172.1 proline dehydrogenase [Neobacillus ginsengisoli]